MSKPKSMTDIDNLKSKDTEITTNKADKTYVDQQDTNLSNQITVLSNSALQYRGTFSGNIGTLINKEHQGMWYITYPNTGLPSGQTGGYLEVVYNPNPNYCKHIFRAVGSVLTFENDLSNGTWGGWKQLATTEQVTVLSGQSSKIYAPSEVATINQTGLFQVINQTGGDVTIDGFVYKAGFLYQLKVDYTIYVGSVGKTQELTCLYNHIIQPYKWFRQYYVVGGWTGWKQLATTDKTPIVLTAVGGSGCTIEYQNCYQVNNHVYINVVVKKTDGTAFGVPNYLVSVPASKFPTDMSYPCAISGHKSLNANAQTDSCVGFLHNATGRILGGASGTNIFYLNISCDYEL